LELNNFWDFIEQIGNRATFKPHRLLMLLAVIDLLEEEPVNRIYFDERLKKKFTKYFNEYGAPGDSNRPHTPFFHLQSSGFWFLQPKKGRSKILNSLKTVGSPSELIDNVEYAFLSESVFNLLTNQEYANRVKTMIKSYLADRLDLSKADHVKEEKQEYKRGLDHSLFHHEEISLRIISQGLKSSMKLLNNILILEEQSKTYLEYDVIIVARSGIYVVELKHWSGHIEIAPYNWIVNGTSYRADPHRLNEFKCKVLKGIYQHQFRTYPNVWVESIVVLTNPEAIIENADTPSKYKEGQRSHTFASLGEFITYLKRRDAEPPILTSKQIEAVAQYISSLNQPRKSIYYTVPGYETIEYRYQSAEYIELLARPKGGQAQGLYRFRIFRPSAVHSFSERQRFQAKALATLKSIELIGEHPNIHRVWINESYDGDIIEGSRWSESGTVRDLIHRQEQGFSLHEAFRICRGITLGLIKAHQTDIIHRAVRPENVLVINGEPRLMNFDLSYHLEDNRITVMPELTKLKDDGYTAPEILDGNDIDETTDFFGLGIIACELLASQRPFHTVKQLRAQGGELSPQFLAILQDKGVPQNTIEVLSGLTVADRNKRLNDADRILEAFALETDNRKSVVDHEEMNPILKPGCMHDGYEILETIETGNRAQIYKARTIRGNIVAIKLFNREVPREHILHEAEVGERINSDYVCRVMNIGYWEQDRYYIVMDYIEGDSLRKKIDSGTRPDKETFISVTRWLIEALQAFHGHTDENGEPRPFVHGDIKPENILLTSDNKPVLIDFGVSGEPRVDLFQGTVGYVSPDSIKGSDRQFSESGDIFALGVVLWEWLFGSRPYEHPAVGDQPFINDSMEQIAGSRLLKWLQKSIATDRAERFESVNAMQHELEEALRVPEQQTAVVEEPDSVEQSLMVEDEDLSTDNNKPLNMPQNNTFVTYLNSLSNTSAGNENATAEAQIGNAFFDSIRVDHPLTDFIAERLRVQNVILTGNAGDGKTTIASEIVKRLTGDYIPLKQRVELPNLIIIKDLSEIPEGERNQVFVEALQNPQKRFLIVSNTGTLINNMKGLTAGTVTVDDSVLLKVLESDRPENIAGDSFMVVNLGQINNIPLAMRIFRKMLNAENWSVCQACSCAESCPINFNVRFLREIEEVVQERTELLYQRMYEYGTRLTMRQMTGHLAFAVTGGRNCQQITSMSSIARQELLYKALFHNLLFGDEGNNEVPEAMQLVPVLQIRQVEFGMVLDPYFERTMWSKSGNQIVLYGETTSRILAHLKERLYSANRNQIRRLVFFGADLSDEWGRSYLQTFLRSPLLLDYLDYTQKSKSIPILRESQLRAYVLHVLQEFFIGVRLPEGEWRSHELYITLRPGVSKSASQMIIASVPSDKFKVNVFKRYSIGEIESCSLGLVASDSEVKLTLELPFLDYVIRRFEGEVAESLTAFYAHRLERFKARLLDCYAVSSLSDNSLRLLRIGKGRGYQLMKVIFSGDQLEVVL
jgi:serine/threonine protein kinase